MGKKSKFRCLFGIKRNKNNTSPPAIDTKLSLPKLLEKCPAQPNQYFQGGREQNRTEDKSVKFDTNKATEIIQTKNQENPEPNDKIGVEKHTHVEVEAAVLDVPGVPLSTEEMNYRQNGKSKKEKVDDIRCFQNENNLSGTSSGTHKNRHSMNHDDRAYEKLIEPKRHHDDVLTDKSSDSTHRDRAKIYKKEFAKIKCNNSYQNAMPSHEYKNADEPHPDDFIKLKPDAITNIPSSDSISIASCSQSQHFEDTSKEWGWITNPTNSHGRDHGQFDNIDNPMYRNNPSRYVNDESQHLCIKNTASDEVSFTVTEKNGKSLHFTIVGNGAGVTVPQLPVYDEHLHNSSTSPEDIFLSHGGHRSFPGNASTSSEFDKITSQNNTTTREMGYPESAPTHTLHPGPSKTFLQSGSQKDPTPLKLHFELSMASYSRLIAYTNKSSSRYKQQSPQSRVPRQTSSFSDQPSASGTQLQKETPEVNDLCRLAKVFETVEECPWYWGAMTGQEAGNILRGAAPGSFLLRDSSDSKHLFSLSMKTDQGPTSIRIVYNDGAFRFDSEMDDTARQRSTRSERPNYVKKITPVFTCVVKMILYYSKHLVIEKSRAKSSTKNRHHCERCLRQQGRSSPTEEIEVHKPEQFLCYWVSRHGRQGVPVVLSKPVPKKHYFPTLQSLCRKTLCTPQRLYANESLADELPLPNSMKKYLKKYPYPV